MKNQFFKCPVRKWVSKTKHLLILLSSLLIYYSCTQDDWEKEAASKTSWNISEARCYFDSEATILRPLSFNADKIQTRSQTLSNLNLVPQWDLAVTGENSMVELVEIPLTSGTQTIIQKLFTDEAGKTVKEQGSAARKLILAKDKQGHKLMFIATLIPDKEHYAKFIKNPYAFRYLEGSDFSGFVFCSALNGEFIEGYRYENGKQVAPLQILPCNAETLKNQKDFHGKTLRIGLGESKALTKSYSSNETGSETCHICHGAGVYGGCPVCGVGMSGELEEVIINYCQACHRNKEACACCWKCHAYPCRCGLIPVDPNRCPVCLSNPCECHRCPYCDRLLCWGTCVAAGGIGSGGSGSSTTRFVGKNIQQTMDIQKPNLCSVSIMEYINRLFGGDKSHEYYMADYLITFHENITDMGVGLKNMDAFINRHFKTTPNTDYMTAITNGFVIFAAIPSDIENSGHIIAVVGYKHQDGQLSLIYMDPATGKLEVVPYNSFNPIRVISITGIQNTIQ